MGDAIEMFVFQPSGALNLDTVSPP